MKIATLTGLCFSVAVIGLATLAQAERYEFKNSKWDNGTRIQRGNNGNHNGWYKNGGQLGRNTGTSHSVPEPASLLLLGAGVAGVAIGRRMFGKR
jgi:hypothetical protein